MNELLIQRDLRFRYKSFLITENGLEIKQKSLLNSREYLLPYENIGTRIYKDNKGIYGLLFSAVLVGLISVLLYLLRNDGEGVDSSVYLFYFGISMIFLTIFLLTYKRNFHLVKHGNTDAVEFLQYKPTKAEQTAFIEVLINTRNTYLLNKYSKINFTLNYEQNYQNLAWLANNEVINNIVFNKMVDQLNLEFKLRNTQKMLFDFSPN